MNLPSFSSAQVLLIGALLIAVSTDLKSRRIPNLLILAGLALAVLVHAWALFKGFVPLAGDAAWSAIAGAAAGLGLMLPLYLLRATGAGDVKLMAMVGAFIGTPTVVSAVLYTLLAGGLLSLVFMLGRGVAAQTFSNLRYLLIDWMVRVGSSQGVQFAPLQHTAARLPYAVAIAMGTVASLLWPLRLPLTQV